MLDISSLDHVAYRANGFFDRNIGVESRRPIYVDMIDTQPLQRIGKEILCRFRPRIKAAPTARRIAEPADI